MQFLVMSIKISDRFLNKNGQIMTIKDIYFNEILKRDVCDLTIGVNNLFYENILLSVLEELVEECKLTPITPNDIILKRPLKKITYEKNLRS